LPRCRVVHRRMLPIAEPCHAFRPEPGASFCNKCEKHVHDLSAMTEREAERFLAARVGEQICVSYRTAKDGTILVRPEPRTIGVVLVALGLAACTGYAPEIQHPDEGCRDAQGYEIDCKMAGRSDVLVMPEEEPAVEPVVAPDAVEVPALPEVHEGRMVGLVAVDPVSVPAPISNVHEFEVERGAIAVSVSTMETIAGDRRSRREARREARRERWASRRSGK
jgi:hypothetical protein